MDLHDALAQIAEIRAHIAQNETFRGFRSASVAASGLLALLGAAIQTLWIPDPQQQLAAYVKLWIIVATVSFLIFATEIALRSYLHAAPQARQLTLLTVQQFVPCLVAGGLLTYAIVVYIPASSALLPGLWAIVFSLGIFASYRLLPPATIWIAGYYLLAGTGALIFSRGENSLSPWAMAATFGAGQLLAATVRFLHWSKIMAKHKPVGQPPQLAGRYAYQGLDRVVHEKARLGILTSLVSNPSGLLFADLKELCGLTDGNLNRHLHVLQEAELVEVWKGTYRNRPQTLCRLTEYGRARFLAYIAALEKVVADAAESVRADDLAQRNIQKGWSPA